MFAATFKYIINMSAFRSICVAILTLLLVSVNISAKENERLFQFGLFPPVSSNGTNSGETINHVSLNLIGGYSAGNRIFELGGVLNASRDYTGGLQIAGLLNYSGYSYNSVQVSGLGNIAASGKSPLQIGGLFNVAGIVNGLQLSCLVNVAKKVKGVQVGLINYIEDGEEGVSIGLINVAKHGGKYEFELSFSETANTLLSFRLGTDRFYSIFSGGINYFFSPLEYVMGLGFGTSIDWNMHWSNQIEIQAYGLSCGKKFKSNAINSIIQIRFPVCREIGSHFKLFVGPTVNLGLQSAENAGSVKLSPWSICNFNWNTFQSSGWIGLSAGFRF